MQQSKLNQLKRQRRLRRVRSKIFGTAERPRVSVYRSNQHIALQAINDELGVTIASGSDLGKAKKITGTKTERAIAAAKELAEGLKKAKVTKVSYDRGIFKYHGRIKAAAQTLRELGIEV